MPTPPFVQFAHALAGEHKGNVLTEKALLAALRGDEPAWVHLDGKQEGADEWIAHHLDYLDPQAIEALLDVSTRSRFTALGNGMILILRGMNFNAGEDPEDMVSIRMWIDPQRIVTISRKRVVAIEKMHAAMSEGQGPETAGEFLVKLVEDVTENINKFQKELDTRADLLEHRVISERNEHLRRKVVDMRLQIIAARRFLGPQRDALAQIIASKLDFLDPNTRREIEEEHVKMMRIVEDMDELRDQAAVLREEISGQISDRLNRNMFVLSVLSAIFLPLGFLTGLFGVNVGGLPGLENGQAFFWLCASMGGLVLVQLLVLWRLRWIGRGG
ncbi:zinc transporter ZntB [Thalassobius vesicularis]|nr:zinc transporter ZntB [Thalassobius vesicularis]